MKSIKKAQTEEQNVKSFIRVVFTFIFILSLFVLSSGGCSSWTRPGETSAEVRRRHKRTMRVNKQQMMADIDKALLLDKPSKLSDKRVP